MNWKTMKLDSKSDLSSLLKRKRTVTTIILVVILLLIFIADDIQQRRFVTLETGYELMQKEEYEAALCKFNTYLSVQSDIYWTMIEKVNSIEYSRKAVEGAVEVCKEAMQTD